MDKNLGLNVLVESLYKVGKPSPVKMVVALYFNSIHWYCKTGVFNSFNDGIAEIFISKFNQVETVSVIVFNSKAISSVNSIMVLFDVIYPWC